MDSPMISSDALAAATTPPPAGLERAGTGTGSERAGKSNSRKSHRKTRTGCRTCKQRKIKCDETRPQCNNCIRHSVRCDFFSHDSPYERSPAPGLRSNVETPPSSSTPHNGFPSNFEGYVPEPSQGLDAPGSLNLCDLELLHNYSTNTASTLHSDPAIRILLRTTVPQLGFQYEFVMRGILATSALHLAHFKPEKRDFYTSQAIRHQETGLRSASSMIPNITEENCSAVYIFSVMAFYFALASPRKPGDFLIVGENGVSDWLFLLKGTRYIMESSRQSLDEGPFAPLFRVGARRNQMREIYAAELTPGNDPISELRNFIHGRQMDPNHLQIYDQAMDGLRKSFIMVYNQGLACETGDVFVWLFQASDGYIHLLRQHTPESLVILAYFCTLMKRLDHYWWMEGWSAYLISKIFYILDEEHKLWIRWPIEEIGWIPS